MKLRAVYHRLKSLGILGMNARNSDYILRYNKRRYYPLVDDKLKTKQLALQNHIAVPPLYAVIEIEHQINQLDEILKKYDDFVIKPAHGSGGDGIVVIVSKRKSGFIKANGEFITLEDLKLHLSNILSGMYSLGGHSDQAIIEYRVLFDPLFKNISFQGVPDIRMIIFKGYPVMSMLRLPTRISQGKANLHQGAIGVGIDIGTGKTYTGTWQNEIMEHHPDTGHEIEGLHVPYWEDILKISASCYEISHLGYLGADLVLDHDKGPLLLELNARPGLGIQIANKSGLAPRLKLIESLTTKVTDIEQRVAFAKENFTQDALERFY